MGRTIVIANQKGGVGKTTTAINLSASLAKFVKRVLVIDMYPQGNTTSAFGIDKENTENSVYDLLLGGCSIKDAIIPEVLERLSVLPSHIDLAAAEIDLIVVEE